jgi:hypothetical protein
MAGKTLDDNIYGGTPVGNRRRYSYPLPDGSFGASIEFDAEDIEDCKETAFLLYTTILSVHGKDVANEIFSQRLMTKRQTAAQKNYRLLKLALRLLSGSRSVEQVAIEIVEINKSRPREVRYGPTGTTSPTTMAKQIRRLMKANNSDISK